MASLVPTAAAAIAFLVAFVVCAGLIGLRHRYMGLVLRRDDVRAVQAAHHTPTPRIGGVALFAGMIAATFLVPETAQRTCVLALVSLLPVFLSGLAEDLGFRVSPRSRLFAAALSGALMVANFGLCIPRLDVPGLDLLMTWAPFATAITILASAGICNAFNLIDGLNGLAGITAVLTAFGLHAVALEAGHPLHAELASLIAAGVLGFLVFNYPFGRIFLGDAGAYALGHVLAWLAIALMVRAETLSPWAVLLIFFWPVADTLFAIYRRSRRGRSADQPDRLHFHQLVMRSLEILLAGRKARSVTNPLATLIMVPMIGAPIAAGVWLWDNALAAFCATALFGILFLATYEAGMQLARRRLLSPPRHRLLPPAVRAE